MVAPSDPAAAHGDEGRAPLVGRTRELEQIEAAFERSVTDDGMRALLLAGDAGTGKSRLLRGAFAVARRQGVRFASGAAYEGASGRPFGPVVDLLRGARRGAARDERDEFEAAIGARASAPDVAPAVSRWAQIDAVVDALGTATSGERPLRLVAFEDLQWADESTLEFLTQVLRQLEPLPIVVLATFRPPATGAAPLLSFIEAARSLPCTERLELGPIPGAAAEALVRAVAGAEVGAEAVAAIVERAEGNPLFLEEAARDAARTAQAGGDASQAVRVPRAIRDLVHGRIATLTAAAREVLDGFAVLGADHDPAIVATMLGRSSAELAPSLDELVEADLLATVDGGRLAFRHTLTRDAVYEAIPPSRRGELHARCADALEADEGPRAAAAMALHLRQIGDADSLRRAGGLLADAGEQSLKQLAYEQAATQLQDAVNLLIDCDEDPQVVRRTRLSLAEALHRTQAGDTALNAYELVADEAAAAGAAETEALAAIGYEQVYLETGRARTGVDARSIPLLDRALAHLEAVAETTEGVAALRARVLAAGAQARRFAGERGTALAMAQEAAEVARDAATPAAEAAALNTLRLASAGPDNIDETLTLTGRIVERAAAAGDVDLELEGLLWQIIALLQTGARTESEAVLNRFATLAERVRHPWRLSELHRMRGMFAHLNGDLSTARIEAEEALRLGLVAGHAEARSPFLTMFTAVASTPEVRAEVEALLAQRALQADTFIWQSFIGWLALSAGDHERASRLGAMAAASGIETLPRDQSWFSYLNGFVEMAIELRRSEWAQVAYDTLLPFADRYLVIANGAFCGGSIELTLARLAEVVGKSDAAEAHRRRANERNEAIGARVWLDIATSEATRVTKTFMFTDIVGSTNLAELLGDEAWGTLLRWHDQTLGELFRAHDGEQVVSTGDGFFVAFDDANSAVACAQAVQRHLADHRATAGFAPEVRIGIHTAEATAEDQNYKGRGVHEAARIGALAKGGEVLASVATAGHHAAPESARTITLKGLTNPVEVVTVPWR